MLLDLVKEEVAMLWIIIMEVGVAVAGMVVVEILLEEVVQVALAI
jgi:hypothetical protein